MHTQSITVPVQGFLNALVYGWTREDFVHTIMHRRDTSASHFSDEGSAINSGSYRSSILASRALSVNKGFSNSRSYRSLNSTSGKFKWNLANGFMIWFWQVLLIERTITGVRYSPCFMFYVAVCPVVQCYCLCTPSSVNLVAIDSLWFWPNLKCIHGLCIHNEGGGVKCL